MKRPLISFAIAAALATGALLTAPAIAQNTAAAAQLLRPFPHRLEPVPRGSTVRLQRAAIVADDESKAAMSRGKLTAT
jgi:hypothetical protein